MLVIVPTGLHPSGVITWATRLVSWLADRGRPAGILLHGRAEGPLSEEIAPGVRVFEHPELPHFDALGGDLTAVIPMYASAIGAMAVGDGPVIVSPNLHGDCYGAVAAVTQSMADRVRVLGWAHSDNRYDARVLGHYEPMLHGFVGVSGVLSETLAASLPGRAGDVHRIPYGVHGCGDCGCDRPDKDAARPLRLVYTGRVEEEQKRASALVSMSRALGEMGVAHELRVLGDGPARQSLERAADGIASIQWLGTRSASEVRDALAWAEAFVLPSRYEGLSVSMLEAMACGCTPVVSRVRSGASEAVENGETGLLVNVDAEASAEDAGRAFAAKIAGTPAEKFVEMGRRAAAYTTDRYGMGLHGERVAALIDRVVAMPARTWPATRPVAFQGLGVGGSGGSGSTPSDAASRLRRALGSLRGKRIGIHGVGRHTRDLASVLASVSAYGEGTEIVVFFDDNPEKFETRLWNWPVAAPAEATAHGVEAVVISSHLHEEAIWARRGVYLDQGVEVVRLYGPTD